MTNKVLNLPNYVSSKNLSLAWAACFLQLRKSGGKEIRPLFIRITGFDENSEVFECPEIRQAVDKCLEESEEQSVHTVANTIFPQEIYRYADNRKELYELYKETMPARKALSPFKNRSGLYFERLIDFGSGPEDGNQLEFIIKEYERRPEVRKSLMQASVFDPGRDHTRMAQLPFPCLQHVSFAPNNEEGTLQINAFYATQQIVPKAYGNYLGLCRLGAFMAKEMDLQLTSMNCFVGIEKMSGKPIFTAPCNRLEEYLKPMLARCSVDQLSEAVK